MTIDTRPRVSSATPAPRRAAVPSADRRARGPAAGGSKIAAAGFSVAGMLGLVAVMASASRSSAAPAPSDALAAPSQVVVHLDPSSGGMPVPAAGRAPIVLAAQPTVRAAPVSAAPAGRTNGSR